MTGTVVEWAKLRGFSKQNAYAIIRRHEIPLDRENSTIDFEVADRIWEASRDPAKQAGAKPGGDARRAQFQDGEEREATKLPGSRIGEAQLALTIQKIRRERLTLDQLEKKLVPLASVRDFESRVFTLVKSQLSVIGSELRDDLAAETDPTRCQQMVDGRIAKALTNIAEWSGE